MLAQQAPHWLSHTCILHLGSFDTERLTGICASLIRLSWQPASIRDLPSLPLQLGGSKHVEPLFLSSYPCWNLNLSLWLLVSTLLAMLSSQLLTIDVSMYHVLLLYKLDQIIQCLKLEPYICLHFLPLSCSQQPRFSRPLRVWIATRKDSNLSWKLDVLLTFLRPLQK